MLVNIDERLKKQLENLRNYNEKGCLDLSYKLLIDYILGKRELSDLLLKELKDSDVDE